MNICCYNSTASDLQVGIVEAEHFSVDEEESVVADEETADPQNELSFKEGVVVVSGKEIQLNSIQTKCVSNLSDLSVAGGGGRGGR